MLQAFLCLLPALAVAIPLLARRYPGARTLARLRRARRSPLPRAPRGTGARSSFEAVLARGGLLIGCSLAVRPPPAPAPAS